MLKPICQPCFLVNVYGIFPLWDPTEQLLGNLTDLLPSQLLKGLY